jgi:hypothetical protein
MSPKKNAMKKEKKNTEKISGERIKVQLDYRTIIFLKSKASLKSWLARYPKARIIP